MKKQFKNPQLLLLQTQEDVLTASGNGAGFGGDTPNRGDAPVRAAGTAAGGPKFE